MAKKDAQNVVEVNKPDLQSIHYEIRQMGKLMRALLNRMHAAIGPDEVKAIETEAGVDIDGDGKIGSVAIKAMCLISVIGLLGISVWSVAEDIDNWHDGSGRSTGTAKLEHDGTSYSMTVDDVKITGVGTAGDANTVRYVARASFDAATDGAVGTNSLGITIPDNAIVWDGYIDVTTALSGTGTTAEVGLRLNADDDIYVGVDYTNALDAAGIVATVPLGTAATAVKMTAARTLSVVITDHALTSGAFTVTLEYDKQPN